MEEDEKKIEKKGNGKLICIIIVLCLLVLGLGGYIAYDKLLNNRDDNTKEVDNSNNEKKGSDSEENITYKSYNIGDKVTVKLNDTTESTFYVLKESTESDEYVTLFAEKNIGNSAFNNDYTDGNDYKGSLIESKLNELTSSWDNVKEKRLITVDELKATGLTETRNEDRCIEGSCPADYIYVKENTFLLHLREDIETNNINEFYWTMTKVSDDNTNRYVYYVHMSGSVDSHIVGYKPGSNENPEGKMFTYFGIRPVIVISKDFVN